MSRPISAEAARVTAVLLGRVGDTLTAGPFLRALRARYPQARLRLVASTQSRQAAELLPWADERLYLGRASALGANARLAAALLSAREDLVVELNPAPSRTAALVVRAIRAPVKAGFQKPRYGGGFDATVPAPRDEEPMLARYARLAELLKAPYYPKLEVKLDGADERWAADAVSSRPSDATILLHCGNFKKFDNRWPEEKFAALGRALREEGRDVAWLAGPGERERTARIAEDAGGGTLFSPPSLGATGALMKRVALVAGSITGTTHLAHAVGARTFGLYAGYTNAVWRPADPKAGGAVSAEWKSCRSIGVDEARHGIVAFLAQAGKR
jgi:ADP-heptose:LPS heptosyltransferase